MHRGISPKVLRYCVGSGILYQTTRGNYRNCVFVGKDEHGVARCAFQRGCQALSVAMFPAVKSNTAF